MLEFILDKIFSQTSIVIFILTAILLFVIQYVVPPLIETQGNIEIARIEKGISTEVSQPPMNSASTVYRLSEACPDNTTIKKFAIDQGFTYAVNDMYRIALSNANVYVVFGDSETKFYSLSDMDLDAWYSLVKAPFDVCLPSSSQQLYFKFTG